MRLPDNFMFSQANLQDYVDCKRRFQLRYIYQLEWPAVESEPVSENEAFLERGSAFHRLVHQYFLGLPEEQLLKFVIELNFDKWWNAFLDYLPNLDIDRMQVFPEIRMATQLQGHRLMGRYDLILIGKGEVKIFDWKTTVHRQKRKVLEERMQTRVYPSLFFKEGHHLVRNKDFHINTIEMVYWFPEFPNEPEIFQFTEDQLHKDLSYLQQLIQEIESNLEEEYLMTDRIQRCQYCRFRSFCNRGIEAGSILDYETLFGQEKDEKSDLSLDFSLLPEIEFE